MTNLELSNALAHDAMQYTSVSLIILNSTWQFAGFPYI